MDIIRLIFDLILKGFEFVLDYLFFPSDGETFSLLRIISLMIAFSISGAIVVFMSQGAILKHFGPNAKKGLSYVIAAASGAVLAVCSCSVLPVFATIRKKGAGIGPAIAFLFSGPAINILAVVLTFSAIGFDMGLVRVISAMVLAIVIGFLMYLFYRKSEVVDKDGKAFVFEESTMGPKTWQRALFFLNLFVILVFSVYEPIPTIIFFILLLIQLKLFFTLDDLKEWGKATFDLAKKIVPLFIIGIFFVGILRELLTEEILSSAVGFNSYGSNILASMFGAVMYFPTMAEVAAIQELLSLGMHKGPALALLLAGPSLSLPNMIIISKVIGIKKGLSYFGLVIVFSALAGFLAGLWIF